VTAARAAPRIEPGVPALVLAPMEGVTDAPMRALLSELGGFTFCVTEFLRVSQTVPGPRVFRRHVPELAQGGTTPAGLPVQVQLLGGDPERLAAAALVAVEAGARAVDLNFGCPARTVNRHDGGATLLKCPERLRAIVAAVRSAVPAPIPVSAKLRLGWDDMRAIHVNAERAAEGGADWLTIHARTKSQGYRPPAYWGPLGEVRRRLRIPVVANGEIWTLEDLRRCRDVTGCEHFMLGRGALADPTLARAAARELHVPGAAAAEPVTTPAGWLSLLRRFAGLYAAQGMPPGPIVCRVKQWLRMANHAGRLPWFDSLKHRESLAELLAHLEALAASGEGPAVGWGLPPDTMAG
jgi:tRNA-dihydrouridine synthase C